MKFYIVSPFLNKVHFCIKAPHVLQDQPLGNWRLKRQVDNGEEIIYKFSPKYVLKAGQSVTVSRLRMVA